VLIKQGTREEQQQKITNMLSKDESGRGRFGTWNSISSDATNMTAPHASITTMSYSTTITMRLTSISFPKYHISNI
jgi:hypothetical protein